MKKFTLTALCCLLLVVSAIKLIFVNELDERSSTKKIITSTDLLQAELNRKIQRRADGYAKQDKPDKYLEYIHLLKTNGDEANAYPPSYALNELKEAQQESNLLKSQKLALPWIERGPGNVGGRTRAFVVDPEDPSQNTWFAGSVGGGIWKTTDGGVNWSAISEDWPNLAVSALAMAPSDPYVMYAGTGEGFGNVDAIIGNGIFKSLDKGGSWDTIAATCNSDDFKYINRIQVHPTQPSNVIAATNTGLFKSVNGGDTWKKVYEYVSGSYSEKIQDLRRHPVDANTLFATVRDRGIVQSIDDGENWVMIKTIPEKRLELAVSPNFPENLYVMTQESNLYISVDGGDNWEAATVSGTKVEFLSLQGWYNNALVAHPEKDNQLYVGGIDVHKVMIGAEVAGDGTMVYDVNNTFSGHFTFANFEGQYQGGGIKVYDVNSEYFTPVEVRFGPGKSQKAVRYFDSGSELATLDDAKYVYRDYVDVPFEVWDTQTNSQLMVSFRDHADDGAFNLTEDGWEQLQVHAIAYDSQTPHADMAKDGGVSYRRIVAIYPQMKSGLTWSPTTMQEEGSIGLKPYALKSRQMTSTKLTVWSEPESTQYAHADHHNLMALEGAGTGAFRLVDCNDGGVAYSDDEGVNWETVIEGYVTTQFYGVSKHPTKDIYIGGTQDNGTWLSPEGAQRMAAWKRELGGDGFETVWHATDGKKYGGSLYYNRIWLTYDGGESWNRMDGIGDADDGSAPFITQIASAPSDPELLFVGGSSGLWRTGDFGKKWQLVQMPLSSWAAGKSNPHVAVSPVNSRYVWAATQVSSSLLPALSKDGGFTFQTIQSPAQDFSAYVSNIIAHPTDMKSAFVLFARYKKPKIYKTEDFGETWIELSGFGSGTESTNGFPDVAVYSLVVMPHDPTVLWAGTEIGLFESKDGGKNWVYADNGLPAVCIWDMKIVGKQVVLGTHGRGIWTVDIPEITTALAAPNIQDAGKKPNGNFTTSLSYPQDFDSVEYYLDDVLYKTKLNAKAGAFQDEFSYSPVKTKFYMQLVGYVGGNPVYSNYKQVDNPTYELPIEKYFNGFETDRYDFLGGDFRISSDLFSDWAIHTNHPYSEQREYLYQLKYPIVVLDKAEDAFMKYRDIAFVEKGEPGTVFGDEKYWDYVIVEGTKDGINWLPLLDGYDVEYSSKWKDYTIGSLNKVPDSKTLFETHTINLHDAFNPKDTILVRFRLYSDQASVGWGWIIDDVNIQQEETGVFDLISEPQGTIRVGPNPVKDVLKLRLEDPQLGPLELKVYDLNGHLILHEKHLKNQSVWEYEIPVSEWSKGVKILNLMIGDDQYAERILKR
jgi:photosystem II stability/assembly factor-like uncharacterized protein